MFSWWLPKKKLPPTYGCFGYGVALAARQAAHPEVASTPEGQRPMTFEEYSTVYKLSPLEPLGSRLDEYHAHFSDTLRHMMPSKTMSEEEKETRSRTANEQLSRVALLLGLPTHDTWLQSHPPGTQGWVSQLFYNNFLIEEAIAQVWTPHIASGGPYGPRLKFRWISKHRRFMIPTQRKFHIPQPPPPSTLEAPTHRPATAEDVAECCPICRFVPIELGETLTVLPCERSEGKHWFHPACIEPWFAHKGAQVCVYSCPQRIDPQFESPIRDPDALSKARAAEHSDYDYSYTFPDKEGLIEQTFSDDDTDEEDWE